METSLCSHLSAVYFFTDSIRNQCPYVAYSCSNFDDFNSGKCSLQCDGNQHRCNRMGYWTSRTDGTGDLYLKTQDANAFPYCSKSDLFFVFLHFVFVFYILKYIIIKLPWNQVQNMFKHVGKFLLNLLVHFKQLLWFLMSMFSWKNYFNSLFI